MPCSHPIGPFDQLRRVEAKTTVDEELTVILADNNIVLLAQKPYNLFDRFGRVLRRGRFLGPSALGHARLADSNPLYLPWRQAELGRQFRVPSTVC